MKRWMAALGAVVVLGACGRDDTPKSAYAEKAEQYAANLKAEHEEVDTDLAERLAITVCEDPLPTLVDLKGDWVSIGLAHDAIAAVCPDQMPFYKALYPA